MFNVGAESLNNSLDMLFKGFDRSSLKTDKIAAFYEKKINRLKYQDKKLSSYCYVNVSKGAAAPCLASAGNSLNFL